MSVNIRQCDSYANQAHTKIEINIKKEEGFSLEGWYVQ
jgi:hypothetical protein